MSEDLIQIDDFAKVCHEIRCNARKFLDDFFKAFAAAKYLENGIAPEDLFKYFTLNQQAVFEGGSMHTKFWFSFNSEFYDENTDKDLKIAVLMDENKKLLECISEIQKLIIHWGEK